MRWTGLRAGLLSNGHSEAHSTSRGRWWVWSVHSRMTADVLELAGTLVAGEGRVREGKREEEGRGREGGEGGRGRGSKRERKGEGRKGRVEGRARLQWSLVIIKTQLVYTNFWIKRVLTCSP